MPRQPRKSAPPGKTGNVLHDSAATARPATPHGPSEGKGKSAGRAKTAPGAKALTAWQAWSRSDDALDVLCRRIVDGETLTAIARSYGTGIATLCDWIAASPERSARSREARIAAAQAYDDMALQAIREASDPFDLARAKEQAHHLRWRATKANPREYGDKVDLTSTVTVKDVSDDEIAARLAKFGIAPEVFGFSKPRDNA